MILLPQGTALAGIFSADMENVTQRKAISLALTPGQVVAYDMMGNRLPTDPAEIAYGRQPV